MKRIIPCTLVLIAVLVSAISASAAIIDPYEDGTVSVDGNMEYVTIKLNTSGMFWQRFHDGKPSYNGEGSDFKYTTDMRYVDNDTVSCWPFGITNYIDSSGIPNGSVLTVDMTVGVNTTNQSQNFECIGYLYLDTYDSNGLSLSRTTVWSETQNPVVDQSIFYIETEIDTAILSGSDKWALVFSFDFNGVTNENDTTQITLQCFGDNISAVIPYSSIYQLQEQGKITNKQLEKLNQAIADNGEKLDEIMNATVPDARPDGSDKVDDLDQTEEDLRNDTNQGLEDALHQMDEVIAGLSLYGGAFFALGAVFNLFFQIPFISLLVRLSMTLGILAILFNIAIDASGAERVSTSNKAKRERISRQRAAARLKAKYGGRV